MAQNDTKQNTTNRMKRPSHPGALVREAIENGLGLSITAAAKGLGVSRKTLSELVNEHAGISPDMALRLEMGIGSNADHWLRLQMAFDIACAREGANLLKVKRLEPA